MYVTTALDHKVPVQLVGRDKIRIRQHRLDLLVQSDLTGLLVSSIDPAPELVKLVPHLRELDLSGALLNSWDQVWQAPGELGWWVTVAVGDGG